MPKGLSGYVFASPSWTSLVSISGMNHTDSAQGRGFSPSGDGPEAVLVVHMTDMLVSKWVQAPVEILVISSH